MTEAHPGRFAGYWRRALGLDATPDPATAAEAVARLTPLFGPVLARAPVADLVPADAAETADAAFRRLLRARQSATLATLREAGTAALAIKGHAVARLYDPPEARILGDLDLLVHESDLETVVRSLECLGFAVELSPQGVLGVTSDVSFHPLVSRDRMVSVDLHTALDAFPLSAAVTAGAVFADAGTDGRPAAHHLAVAAVSNAAKERFAPYAWRHLVDLGRLALQEPVDWPEADRVLLGAGLGPARATACGALRVLGVPKSRLPPDAGQPSHPARHLADNLATLRIVQPGWLSKAAREIGWCYTSATCARLWRFRLAGLLQPRSGVPTDTAATS